MALSDKWLKANSNKDHERIFEKGHRDGMAVRVSKKGKITFIYKYYVKETKKRDKCTIGSYPEISLSAATKEISKLKNMLSEGKNPRLELMASRIYEAKKHTLNELYLKWYVNSCSKRKKNHEQHRRTYELYLQKKLGKLIAENITRTVFLEVINPIIEQHSSIAERIIVDLKQMYAWSRIQNIIDESCDPLKDITATVAGITKGHDVRFFNHQEIAWFWLAHEKTRISEKNKIYLELVFHYGCRPSELRLAEKKHVNLDLGTWSVPYENHKVGKRTKQPIVRPIIPELKQLWQRAFKLSGSKKWVFTNVNSKEQMGHGAVAASMRCIETYWRKQIKENGKHITYDPFYLYTLRKTARTNFAEFGEWAVCEKMIGHALPGETDKYDYNTYSKKMLPIYRGWYELSQKIRNHENNIVSLHAKII